MRPVVSLVAGIVTLIAALVAVPLFWVSTHVADEDGYVGFSRTLATDDELQVALAAYLADDFVQRGVLPAELQESATGVLTSVAQQATNEPGFVEAWEATQRSLHQSAFSDQPGPLTVDVGPIATFVADGVGDRLPVSIEVRDSVVVPLGADANRDNIAALDRSTTYALVALMVVVVSAAVSLMAARSRPVALAGLGLGALVTAGVLQVVTEIVAPKLLDDTAPTTAFAGTFRCLLIDRVSISLAEWLGWIAVAGAGAVVLGVVGRLVSGRPTSSS